MAKVEYPGGRPVITPPNATEVHCVGVNIRAPIGGNQRVSFYYESLSAAGSAVDSRPMDIDVPAELQAAVDTLTTYALNHVDDAGYPAGGNIR